MTTKGQGAQTNPDNRFAQHTSEVDESYLNYLAFEGEEMVSKIKVIEVFPKSVVNAVTSPDVPMEWSMNPYQGCEHGCTYCYARNSHEYWGYSAGVDFERVILVKKNAPEILDQTLKKKSWKASPIVLSGNTDCYQPIERKLGITRACIEVMLKHQHPMGIITKNALVQRDVDLLQQLAQMQLAQVVVSINTLNEDLRQKMEPRTASIKKRLETVEALSAAGIPVTVLIAPIVPGLNSHEVFELLKASKQAGARDVGYTMVRLNGQIADIFSTWIHETFTDKAQKVLNQIRAAHEGSLKDNQFGRRMKGSGKEVESINQTFKMARKKFFGEPEKMSYNLGLYEQNKNPQLKIF
jgi:DNA repair photolyase